MIEKIKKWLEDPKRDYYEGLKMFSELASPVARQQFLQFLSQVKEDEEVDQFDNRFTILVNQMTFVKVRLQSNKDAFKESVNLIPETKKATGPLKLQDLPKQFDKERARLTELVPLMARIHADMSVETISDEDRKKLADELVKLDLERRSIWDRIDNYLSEMNQELVPEEKMNDYSENDLVKGVQMAARVKRLQDNIRQNETAIVKHQNNNKPHLVATANQRIEKYKAELAELEVALKVPDEE